MYILHKPHHFMNLMNEENMTTCRNKIRNKKGKGSTFLVKETNLHLELSLKSSKLPLLVEDPRRWLGL